MGAVGLTSPGHPRPLQAVLVATFFVRFGFGLTLAVFTSYLTGAPTGLSFADVGIAGTVSALAPIGEFSTVLLSGVAADRWGRFPVLFAGMGAAALLLVLVSTTRSVIVLGGANLLFGVASGAILAASLAVVSEFSDAQERGLEMGRFDAMNLSGWIGGYAFGFGVEALLPNRLLDVVFLSGAAALLAGLVGAGRLSGGGRWERRPRRVSVRLVLRSAVRRDVLLVIVPWLAIYSLIGTALVFLGPAAGGVGIRPGYLALAIAGGGSLLVVTQPTFGRWADRRGRTRMMTIGAAGFILVLLLASLLIAWGPSWPLLAGIGAAVLMALTYGPAALAALADLSIELSRATTMALYSLTISLGMVVGLLAASGLVSRFGPPGLYPYFAAIAIALAVLTALRWRSGVGR